MSDKPNGTLILRLQASGTTTGWLVDQMETAGRIVVNGAAGQSLRLSTFPQLTFAAQVHPSDLVSVYAAPAQNTSVPLQLWRQQTLQSAEELVCQGTLDFAATDAAFPAPQASEAAPITPAAPAPAPEPEEEPEAELRDFTRDMVPALRDHLKTSFQETYSTLLSADELNGLCETLTSADVGGMLMDDSRAQLVITLGDKIIGSAMCASQHNITYVWGMYVQQAYQRVGLGQSLMEAMLQKLPEKGMVELTVLKDSEAAVNFFTSIGFKGHRSGEIEFVPGKTLVAANMYANVKTLRN